MTQGTMIVLLRWHQKMKVRSKRQPNKKDNSAVARLSTTNCKLFLGVFGFDSIDL